MFLTFQLMGLVALDFKLRSLKCIRDSELFRKVYMSHIKCGVLLTN